MKTEHYEPKGANLADIFICFFYALFFFERRNLMKNQDLFEDVREIMGCLYISDLRRHQKEILAKIPKKFFDQYSKEQRQDFYDYISEKV